MDAKKRKGDNTIRKCDGAKQTTLQRKSKHATPDSPGVTPITPATPDFFVCHPRVATLENSQIRARSTYEMTVATLGKAPILGVWPRWKDPPLSRGCPNKVGGRLKRIQISLWAATLDPSAPAAHNDAVGYALSGRRHRRRFRQFVLAEACT